MDVGSNKSLFTLLAVVIFGVFLSLSYWLLQDELVNVLADVMDGTSEMTSIKLENDGLIPTESKYFSINSTGKITDYDLSGGKDVIIPSHINGIAVTTIGGDAFYNKGINSLILPNTITKIETGTRIYDSNGEVVGYYGAFMGNNLEEITIPSSVSFIGLRAFKDNNIKELNLNEGLTRIEADAFHNNDIVNLDIPNSVTAIDWHAFGSNKITTLKLGTGLKSIGSIAFNNNQIKSVTLPETLTQLGYLWLWHNPIVEINISNNLESYINSHQDAISNDGYYTKETGYIITSYYESSILNYY
jgi:hypothetical protein